MRKSETVYLSKMQFRKKGHNSNFQKIISKLKSIRVLIQIIPLDFLSEYFRETSLLLK